MLSFCSDSKEHNLTLAMAGTACWGEALAKTNAPPYESRNVGPVTVPA